MRRDGTLVTREGHELEVETCDRCGVLVVATDAERHGDWHDRVSMREHL